MLDHVFQSVVCFVDPEMATNSERRSLQLEIDMLRELGCHRHLVSMLAWCLQGDQLALVLEYIPGGNLQEFLRSQRHNVIISCCRGLLLCHIFYSKARLFTILVLVEKTLHYDIHK